MTEGTTRHPVEALAEDFLACYRAGAHPSISEYTAKYPELAGELADLLQTLVLLEIAESGPSTAVDACPPLERLGDYRLLREVGRGGMGIVYEAEQESLGRRVAVKVLPAAALLNPTARERFEREARAAARLHHTNIVPIYGVGQQQGVHYYAMQFIEGCGLDAVLDSLRSKQPTTARPADETLRQVLSTWPDSAAARFRYIARLGLQVAEALAYAHGQGILHRDIKPANILLEPDGVAWLSDFGLAQMGKDGGLTNTGDIAGTLRYLAPERLTGPATERSDQYSLGLSLYELATLTPAFGETDRVRLLWDLAHREVSPPRHLAPELPVDLEKIILKTVAHQPVDRYARAAELAEDLRRFLMDRPVRARPPSRWERVRRWGKQNRQLATAVGLTLLALLMGLTLTAWQWRQTQLARDQQAEERRRAEQRLKWLQQLTIEVNENVVNLPGMEPARLRLLESIAAKYEQHLADARQDPMLFLSLIRVYQRLGGLAKQLGKTEQARDALAKAAELMAASDCPLPEIARLQEQMTIVRERLQLPDTLALPASELEREFARHAERMRVFKPDDLHFLMSTALALRSTAVRQMERSEWSQAADTVQTCLRFAQQWRDRVAEKDNSWKIPACSYAARCHGLAGKIFHQQGQLVQAREAFEAGLKLSESLLGSRYGDEDHATLLKDFLSLGPATLGEAHWRDSSDRCRLLTIKLRKNHPDVVQYHVLAIAAAVVRARGLQAMGDKQTAAQACEEGLRDIAEAEVRFEGAIDLSSRRTELELLKKELVGQEQAS